MSHKPSTPAQRQRAAVYRDAARIAARVGGNHLMAWWALQVAEKHKANHTTQCCELEAVFGDPYIDGDFSTTDDDRIIALCLMAAMIESGDA